jgi:membrane protein
MIQIVSSVRKDMLVFRRYWLKLIAYFDEIYKSVKSDRSLQLFVVHIVFLFCADGAFLVVWGEVFLDLIRADVSFVWYGLIWFTLPSVFVAWVDSRSYRFYLILLQLSLVSFFILCFEAAYIFIRQSPKIVNGQQVDEVISADSSYIALCLILVGLGVMIGYCLSERMFKLSCQMIVGILAIVGILLPDILTSYRVVKLLLSECVDTSTCGDGGVLSSLSLIESTLAAAALAMLFILSSILVPVYAQRYFRKNADLADESHLSSGNSHNLMECNGGSVSAVSLVVSDEHTSRQDAALRLSGSADDVSGLEGLSSDSGGAVSKQLMTAAVSGVVAGVCFSVASRLFGRR